MSLQQYCQEWVTERGYKITVCPVEMLTGK